MKRSDVLFGGKPPRVMRMDPRRRPLGWRDEVLATLHPLSREAFAIRREPLSDAEAKVQRAEFAALEWRIEVLDLIDELQAQCDELARLQRKMKRRGPWPARVAGYSDDDNRKTTPDGDARRA